MNVSKTIKTGEFRAETGGVILQTLLGSCVSVCLYDPNTNVYGLNHFMLPYQKKLPSKSLIGTTAGHYGMYAMELLINEMLQKGALKNNLQAKVFGGAHLFNVPDNPAFGIGELNVQFVLEFLENEGIPIRSRDTGGSHARKIILHPNFDVLRRLIPGNETYKLQNDEKGYLRKVSKPVSDKNNIVDYFG